MYLATKKFTVFTDHLAVKTIQTSKQKTGRIARWSLLLQSYNFTVEYKPGKNHSNADGLSRRDYPPEILDSNDPINEVVIAK